MRHTPECRCTECKCPACDGWGCDTCRNTGQKRHIKED